MIRPTRHVSTYAQNGPEICARDLSHSGRSHGTDAADPFDASHVSKRFFNDSCYFDVPLTVDATAHIIR